MKRFEFSLVVPTYNEKSNVSKLLIEIQKEFKKNKISGQIIFVDDNSPDGTGDLLDKLSKDYSNVFVIHRKKKLGLSSAVIDGWKISSSKIFGVMDSDLSHSPKKLKELYFPVKKRQVDLCIGSRYVPGGKIVGWGFKRKLMSKTATFLARIYTSVRDPMTGYFVVKKECLKEIKINPKGFKILLDILVKGNCKKIKEIPLVFYDRCYGKSKAGLKEIFRYLYNLITYSKYLFK